MAIRRPCTVNVGSSNTNVLLCGLDAVGSIIATDGPPFNVCFEHLGEYKNELEQGATWIVSMLIQPFDDLPIVPYIWKHEPYADIGDEDKHPVSFKHANFERWFNELLCYCPSAIKSKIWRAYCDAMLTAREAYEHVYEIRRTT